MLTPKYWAISQEQGTHTYLSAKAFGARSDIIVGTQRKGLRDWKCVPLPKPKQTESTCQKRTFIEAAECAKSVLQNDKRGV